MLLVGNHSGGNMTPDTIVFTLAFSTYFGVERRLPPARPQPRARASPSARFLRKYGTVAASHENAAEGARVRAPPCSSIPGGDWEVHRPTLGAQQGRLRRAQGLHPPGARAGRADRPGGLDRRPGDGALPQPRRTGSRSCWALDRLLRLKVLPDLARRCPGASTSATCSATSRCRPRSRSRCCRRSTCASEFGAEPDVDEVYDHVTRVMQETLDTLAAERRFPVIG